MATRPRIEPGDDVFVHDGEDAIGAVRRVNPREITVFVENAGDYVVPQSAVLESAEGKVVLDCRRLPSHMRHAIGHAHVAEDPDVA